MQHMARKSGTQIPAQAAPQPEQPKAPQPEPSSEFAFMKRDDMIADLLKRFPDKATEINKLRTKAALVDFNERMGVPA